jgi:hypothetical protein
VSIMGAACARPWESGIPRWSDPQPLDRPVHFS